MVIKTEIPPEKAFMMPTGRSHRKILILSISINPVALLV